MNKKTIIGFVLGWVAALGIMGFVANAAPVTPITGGGTGTSTVPADGNLLVGLGGNYVFISSSTLTGGGGSGGVTTSSVLVNGTLPIATGAGSLGNSFVTQVGSSTEIPILNNVISFPSPSQLATNGCVVGLLGSSTITDAGACWNYLVQNVPSSTQISVRPGYWLYSTPIVINNPDKEINIVGSGGGGLYFPGITTFQYTSSTGVGFTYSVQKFSTAGVGIYNLSLIGPAGPGHTGSSTLPTTPTSSVTLGVYLGGGASPIDGGATGFTMQGVQISGFGKGLQLGDNTFIVNITSDVINNNGMNVYMPSASNAFENDKFTNDLFGNCNSSVSPSSGNCIFMSPTASADVTFTGNDFDTSQIVVSSTGTGNVIIHLSGSHFENAGVPAATSACYPFITTTPGQANFVTVYSSGNTYLLNGATGNCAEEINNGANFISSGDTIGGYSMGSTATINFVKNQDAADTVNWFGLNQTWQTLGGQNTFVYASTTISRQGFGTGTSNAVYSVSSTVFQFPNLTIGKLLALDGLGDVITTGTPSGGGSGVPSTTPFFSTGFVYDNNGSLSASSTFTFAGPTPTISTINAVNTASNDFIVGDASGSINIPFTVFHKAGSASGSLSGFGINLDLTAGGLQTPNTSTNGYAWEKDSRNGASSTNLLLEAIAGGAGGQNIEDQFNPNGGGFFGAVYATGSIQANLGNATAPTTNIFQIASTTNTYLGVTSSGIPLFLGTSTVSLGGASLALNACTSTITTVPFVLSTSTDIINTEAQTLPGGIGSVDYDSYISSVQTGSSSITTQVCGLVTAGVTPVATKYNFSIQRESGM